MFPSYHAEKETIGFLFNPLCTDLYMAWIKESLPPEAFLDPTFRAVRHVLDNIEIFSGGFQDLAVLLSKANVLGLRIDISNLALAFDHESHTERSAIECAKIVVREYRLRKKRDLLLKLANDGQTLVSDEEKTHWELTAPARVTELFSDSGQDPVSASALAEEVLVDLELESRGRTRTIPTGFQLIDNVICGLKPGHLIVIGGRPSMGKTALATNLLLNICEKGNNILFFSLEMTRVDLMKRLASILARVSMDGLALNLNASYEAIKRLSKLNFWIEDKAGISVEGIASECRKHKAVNGLDMIIVDYLQLATTKKRCESEAQRIGTMSKALKNLSKDLDIPVVALSQLNRDLEKRNDKRPILADLKSSGDIEQDSDIVVFLHRPGYFDKKEDPSIVEIVVAKNRNGPIRTVMLGSDLKYSLFYERKREI